MSSDVAREIIENIANGPTHVITKNPALGPLAEPWSAFRDMALTTMIAATSGFTTRTS